MDQELDKAMIPDETEEIIYDTKNKQDDAKKKEED